MLLLSYRRWTISRLLRLGTTIFLFCTIFEALSLRYFFLSSSSHRLPPSHPPHHHHHRPRIFIASTHWNNEEILQAHWNDAVLALVRHFGVENVYVSIYESGSWDGTKAALRKMEGELGRLGVARRVVLDERTHGDEMSVEAEAEEGGRGWVDTPRGRRERRRIPFLAKMRNLSLEPLREERNSSGGFDKVLFLNDVVFKTADVLELLDTNGGRYAAACALDFAHPPRFYDTFALRDAEGEEAVMPTWPYFGSRASRHAVISNRAVPVSSCWNGMAAIVSQVFMDATPFTNPHHPLQFRGIPDTLATAHLEGSECCLIHADNPLTIQHGIYLSPHVRVAYTESAYNIVHARNVWISMPEFVIGIWENRIRRWLTMRWLRKRAVAAKVRAWEKGGGKGGGEGERERDEPGGLCLVDEMQVLVENGWAHV